MTAGLPAPSPMITGIDPSSGPAAGGYPIRLTGSGLAGVSSSTFAHGPAGNSRATVGGTVTHATDTEITVTVPSLTLQRGVEDVMVAVPGSNEVTFRAMQPPVVESIVPRQTAPKLAVEITGKWLDDPITVMFGTIPAAATYPRPANGPLTVRRPPGPAGPTEITVVAAGGTSDPTRITFTPGPDRWWVFVLQVVYFVTLIGLVVLYATREDVRGLVPNPIGPMPLGVVWFGALGAVTLSISGLVDHYSDWDPTYTWWHVTRPIIGIAFGSAAYLVFAAGVLASGGLPSNAPAAAPTAAASSTAAPSTRATTSASSSANQTSPATTVTSTPATTASPQLNNLFYYILAFIVGFREGTFRAMIKKVSDVIFGPGDTPPAPAAGAPPRTGGTAPPARTGTATGA